MTYEILHGETLAASITLQGECEIYEARFMPCNLYLEQTDELDGRVNNVTNFYYWCATRVLSLDRKYAKEILNSMGMGHGYGQGACPRRAVLSLSVVDGYLLGAGSGRKHYFCGD